MGRKGNCWDNAPMESFCSALKSELVYHRRFSTREQARREIDEPRFSISPNRESGLERI